MGSICSYTPYRQKVLYCVVAVEVSYRVCQSVCFFAFVCLFVCLLFFLQLDILRRLILNETSRTLILLCFQTLNITCIIVSLAS